MRRLLLSCLVLATLSSCTNYITTRHMFRKVVTTDYQGNVISEWTAVGWMRRIEGGYEFRTVEKIKPSDNFAAQYVIGRKVRVIAPNIAVYRVPPPEWMRPRMVVVEAPPEQENAEN